MRRYSVNLSIVPLFTSKFNRGRVRDAAVFVTTWSPMCFQMELISYYLFVPYTQAHAFTDTHTHTSSPCLIIFALHHTSVEPHLSSTNGGVSLKRFSHQRPYLFSIYSYRSRVADTHTYTLFLSISLSLFLSDTFSLALSLFRDELKGIANSL